nr:hypothetical protein [Candidatus Pacearchaeota archaeon]
MEQTKFLGKFPYKVMLSHETQRILEVSDQTGRYNTNLSFAYYPEQIEISTAMSHEGIDKHLIPRLNLLRELYNAISQDLKI